MFTAWVIDSGGNTVKCLEDCVNISYFTFEEMEERYPAIVDAIGIDSEYFCVTDSQGQHFYPQYICSINLG